MCTGLLCRLQLHLVCFTFSLAQTCVNQLGEPLAHYKKDIESHFQSIKSLQAKLGMGWQVLTVELQQWSVTALVEACTLYCIVWSMSHHSWGVVLERFGCLRFLGICNMIIVPHRCGVCSNRPCGLWLCSVTYWCITWWWNVWRCVLVIGQCHLWHDDGVTLCLGAGWTMSPPSWQLKCSVSDQA